MTTIVAADDEERSFIFTSGFHCRANMAAKEELQHSLFDLACAKVAEAHKLMSEARELVKQDLDNLKEEKTAFEKLSKTLDEVHFGSSVKLNVGGKVYKTTLDTLRKDPDSMLCAMFSGGHELKPDSEDGAYFIDRDGKLFRYILNYLRHGELLCPDDKILRNELLNEASFYQVQGIISQLQDPFTKLSRIIKNGDHGSTVMSWLPSVASCTLIFRASSDGETAGDFHRCCDNKGPTLIVIQSEENIFGGYTSKSWTSPSSLTAFVDTESFLFTLVNPAGNQAVKISPKSDGGIQCLRSRGPVFGTKIYYDLKIWDGSQTGFLELGYGFNCPSSADKKEYFTGNHHFAITELEVYKLEF